MGAAQEFVPQELIDEAYDDRALPIGLEQTISQPYTVAFMCQEAGISAGDKVLEIGTGSGYGAAVLSLLGAGSAYDRANRHRFWKPASGWPGWVTITSMCIIEMARSACRTRRRSTRSSSRPGPRICRRHILSNWRTAGVS